MEIGRAVGVLRAGGLVAFPTETVYGLGADAANPAAVARVFRAKGRPASHPLIVHLAEAREVEAWAADPPPAVALLAERFWPGPLTLIVRRTARALDAVTGGQDTVGLRVPNHPVAQALLRAFGGAIAAPSANRFTAVSPTTAAHVRADLGDAVDVILDGGPSAVGLESTILDVSSATPRLLRPGAVTREALEATLGRAVEQPVAPSVRAPGQHALHYAPRARVELLVPEAVADRARTLMDEGARVGVLAPRVALATLPRGVKGLELPDAIEEAAQVLYARLREADALGLDVLLTVAPATGGLGDAITDRLTKAAGPRDGGTP